MRNNTMQTLQLDKKIDSMIENLSHDFPLDQKSRITWRDIQGLTWLFEDDF